MYNFRRSIGILAVAAVAILGLLFAQRSSPGFDLLGHKIENLGIGQDDHDLSRKWWKEAVVYEIYPASFKDSNDDGIGDIQGITSKLDYLRDLGVEIIHICPHYQSPQIDMGYDISNYEEVHKPYGTVEDVQGLINATHARGMKIIFDLVINHSSSMHKWFQESRSSKDNPKRDWYLWLPPKIDADNNRHPPNNWRSHFTVPAVRTLDSTIPLSDLLLRKSISSDELSKHRYMAAPCSFFLKHTKRGIANSPGLQWTWDEATQEYYLHIYAPEMPDFNWDNEETRRAVYNTSIIFWLERGIDGFRIDTVNKYSKDITFPDAEITQPNEETQPAWKYYNHGPRIHEFLGEMKAIFDRYKAVTVGELSSFPRSEEGVMEFVSSRTGQLNMVFNFDIVTAGRKKQPGEKGPLTFKAEPFKKEISRWQVFASQEIGMNNLPKSWPVDEYKDIRSVNLFKQAQQRCNGDEACMATALDDLWKIARDHARLPMQWDGGPNAGFTSEGVTPWMRVHDDWEKRNAQSQLEDPNSLLEFWKRMLKLRKEYKSLFIYGQYKLVETEVADLFVFIKEGSGIKSLTVVNFSGSPKRLDNLSSLLGPDFKFLVGTTEVENEEFLAAWEGRVYLGS